MINYSGQVKCLEDGCGWSEGVVRPDDVALTVAQFHVEETGHQVSYDLILSRVEDMPTQVRVEGHIDGQLVELSPAPTHEVQSFAVLREEKSGRRVTCFLPRASSADDLPFTLLQARVRVKGRVTYAHEGWPTTVDVKEITPREETG